MEVTRLIIPCSFFFYKFSLSVKCNVFLSILCSIIPKEALKRTKMIFLELLYVHNFPLLPKKGNSNGSYACIMRKGKGCFLYDHLIKGNPFANLLSDPGKLLTRTAGMGNDHHGLINLFFAEQCTSDHRFPGKS